MRIKKNSILVVITLSIIMLFGCKADDQTLMTSQNDAGNTISSVTQSPTAEPADSPSQTDEPIAQPMADNVEENGDPTPAHLLDDIDWIIDNRAELYYTYACTMTKFVEQNQRVLKTNEKKDLLKLIKSEPVYYYEIGSRKGTALNVSVKFKNQNGEDLILTVRTDHSVHIRYNRNAYVSYSTALFNKLLQFANVKDFSLDMLKSVTSITIKRKSGSGKINTVNIRDKQTIDKVVASLSAATEDTGYGDFRWPNVEMILHTDTDDILCNLMGEGNDGFHEYAGCIIINRFYVYESRDAADLIRSLTK